jgi:hypothetical protein
MDVAGIRQRGPKSHSTQTRLRGKTAASLGLRWWAFPLGTSASTVRHGRGFWRPDLRRHAGRGFGRLAPSRRVLGSQNRVEPRLCGVKTRRPKGRCRASGVGGQADASVAAQGQGSQKSTPNRVSPHCSTASCPSRNSQLRSIDDASVLAIPIGVLSHANQKILRESHGRQKINGLSSPLEQFSFPQARCLDAKSKKRPQIGQCPTVQGSVICTGPGPSSTRTKRASTAAITRAAATANMPGEKLPVLA